MKVNLDKTYKYHGRLLGWGSGPDADWKVMFSIFTIVVLVVVLLAAALFIDSNTEVSPSESAVELPLNLNNLHRTAAYYEKQKLDFEAARTSPEIIPDPSL